MIQVQEALDLVLTTVAALDKEEVSLAESIGRILAEDVFADRPFPPFDRVTMDGIAIQYAALQEKTAVFEIESIGPAGAPQCILHDPTKCIEIMTGASLPQNTDTVIRYEDLVKDENTFRISAAVKKGQNIHRKGSDHEEDSILVQSGTKIKAIDVNVLASVGKSVVQVFKLPKVAVISSGDELVAVDQVPADYQIRRSNVHMLMARLRELGIMAQAFHFQDNEEDIYGAMQEVLKSNDVLLMSGGVSKGKFDFIPSVLDRLGFKKLFHRVAQRPGKPFWFGHLNRKTVFAFPGNPVSTLACFHRYFMPWLHKSLGVNHEHLKVVLSEDVHFKPDLTYFAQASLAQKADGRFYATIKHGNGSGDIVNPISMQGFVEFPAGKLIYKAGEMYDFMTFTPLFR